MSDKPLAEGIENWAKKLEEEWEIEIAQHLRGTILLIKDFAAEHLTEQTEPSAGLRAWTLNMISASDFDGAPTTEEAAEILGRKIFDLIEQGRRHIRELLVGKETK